MGCNGISQEFTAIIQVIDNECLNQFMGNVNGKEEIFCKYDRQNLVTNYIWDIRNNREA